MGRLAELFEKKATGVITDAELKEFDTLQKEAAMLVIKTEEPKPTEPKTEPTAGDPEDEVEKLAQQFADSVTSKMSGVTDRLDKIVSAIDAHQEIRPSGVETGKGYFYDTRLGKKIAVADLSQQKVVLDGRKEQGKKTTSVSMRTVHFLAALRERNVEKLQVLSEGVAADGGFLVPEEFANMIVEDIRDLNIMRQIAAPAIPITTDTFHLPNLASRPKAAWRSEKATKNTSTANFGENVFTPYSLAAIVPLSNELVADASLGVGASIVNYVGNLMSTALAEKEEEAFWTGNGTGKPTGIDGGAYSLRTVTAAATDVSRADSVIQAFQRTPQGYRNRGVWVGNSSTWEEIGRLKDSQNRYLLTDLANSPTQTLRGRPVYESNYLAGGTLIFGDFSFYQIVDREGISVRVSDEATVAGQSAFERNLTFIRVEKRVDAELTLPAAVTKVTGLGTP
jgi:HK97 family phage major capsid protein